MSLPRDPVLGDSDPRSLESTQLHAPPSDADPERTLDATRTLNPNAAPAGPRVGRFVLLRRLGAGAMGVVWSAYDEVLDRKVAIKLFRPDRSFSAGDRERMLREARAMARLSHANIVQVFDAGDDQGRVFVAMELVGGSTLRAWFGAVKRRSIAEIVAMFGGIAAGLAAAHDAGVVHRDLKPENVMLDERGAPKVADFGLARLGVVEEPTIPLETTGSGERDVDLTATGAVIGTPAYMAPEQHRGEPATAASDQFALCVALWEALHGTRPFVAPNLAALATAVCEGRRAPPSRADVPAWLQNLVERGLATDPAARWPSMSAVVHELGRARTRNRAGILAAGAVVVAGTVAVLALRGPEPCRGGRDQIATSWDDARRDRVTASFADGTAFVRSAIAATLPRIDAWAAAWAEGHDEACRATTVRRDQSSAVMDLRIACLHRARQSLDAVALVLERADADALLRSDDIVAQLDDLAACADVDALQAGTAPPSAAERDAVDAARAGLAQIAAFTAAGKLDAARASLHEVETHVADIAYAPVHAELLLARGEVLDEADEDTLAEPELRAALEAGIRGGNREIARVAASSLIRLVGYELDRPAEALALVDVARGLSRDDGREAATLARGIGSAYLAKGDYAAAIDEFERALALLVADPAATPHQRLTSRLDLATAMNAGGRTDEALATFERSIGEVEALLGADHPDVARTHHSYATLLVEAGRLDEAQVELDRALAITAATLGDDSDLAIDSRAALGVLHLRAHRPELAQAQTLAVIEARKRRLGPRHVKVGLEYGNLGMALQAQGRMDDAAAAIATALDITAPSLGASHPNVIALRGNYGGLLHAMGRFDEAIAEHRAAAAALRDAVGADHPDTATSHYNIAVVSAALERWQDVESETAIALPVWRAKLGDEHRLVYAGLALRGRALYALHRDAEAIAAFEVAWKGQAGSNLPPRKKAETALAFARALAGTDEARARALGHEAVALATEAGDAPDAVEVRREAEGWLASLGR